MVEHAPIAGGAFCLVGIQEPFPVQQALYLEYVAPNSCKGPVLALLADGILQLEGAALTEQGVQRGIAPPIGAGGFQLVADIRIVFFLVPEMAIGSRMASGEEGLGFMARG